jgi:uncharacterized membrane protein
MNLVLLIIVMLLSTFISALASLLIKLGSESLKIRFKFQTISNLLRNWRLIVGLLIYVVSTALFVLALKLGELSVVYPLTAFAYVFAVLLSYFVLKEHISKFKIIGTAIIMLGIILVTI